uniref:Single domain-containing protein n=1 Tax=Amblyomma triste TaxID=251400 RepID=A0A023GCL0_AMBTT
MLKFSNLFLVIATLLSACVVAQEEDERNVTSLEFFNGKCLYGGLELEDGETRYESDPCERWECKYGDKNLEITGCALRDYDGSCFFHSSGRSSWPYCCRYERYC